LSVVTHSFYNVYIPFVGLVGEESSNTPEQREQFSDYIKATDPYKHPIVSHHVTTLQQETFAPLLGYASFDGPSLNLEPEDVFESTLEWVQRSSEMGHPWVVSTRSNEVIRRPPTSDDQNSLLCAL